MDHRNQGYESAQRTCRDMDDKGLAEFLEIIARMVVRGRIENQPAFIQGFAFGQLEGVLEIMENRRQHFMYHTAAEAVTS